MYSNPEGARNYTFLQSQVAVAKMRLRRRPANPDTIESLSVILNEPRNQSYVSTLQTPSSRLIFCI